MMALIRVDTLVQLAQQFKSNTLQPAFQLFRVKALLMAEDVITPLPVYGSYGLPERTVKGMHCLPCPVVEEHIDGFHIVVPIQGS